jgi:ribosomal protein S18 acetylase RimI-like enzyme
MRNIKIRFTSAAALPLAQLVELINDTYQDYPIEVWFDRERLAQMCTYEDVDLERSVVAWVDAQPVGMALLSIRGRAGWVSGVGVRPAWRRRGIASCVIARIQEQARRAGLARLTLEVLTQNTSAQALYRDAGFAEARDLLVLVAEPEVRSPTAFPEGVELADAGPLLSRFAQFHEVEPSWQRSYPSLAHRIDHLTGLGLWRRHELCGYLLAQRYTSTFSVLDLAVDPEDAGRLTAAGQLLTALHALAPTFSAHVINLPAEDPLLPAFRDRRYRVWQRQYEMAWSVPEDHEEASDGGVKAKDGPETGGNTGAALH